MSKQQSIQNSNYWKYGVGCGLLLFIGTFWYMKSHHLYNTPDGAKIRALRKKIDQSYANVEGSLVSLSPIKHKEVSDEKLTIKFTLVQNLGNKFKSSQGDPKNPFIPPFQKGMLITELNPGHRLLYNKFNYLKNHLIIVTHDFQHQTQPLNKQDFYQCALVISALNGCFFFNSGSQSGFSQKHKHIQILPEEALDLPITKKIRQQIKANKLIGLNKSNLFLLNDFDFIHAIRPLKQQNSLNLDEKAQQFLNAYEQMKKLLSAVLKKPDFSYNIIGCDDFIMMIPRKKQFIFKSIGVNACGFMGSMLFKDQKLFDKIQMLTKPSEILKEITYTQKPN